MLYFKIEITLEQAAMIDAALEQKADDYATLKAIEIGCAYKQLQIEIQTQIEEQMPF